MIRDITLGQFFPGQSPVHRMDPRMKVLLTIVYIILLFSVGNWLGFLVVILFLAVSIGISKIPFKLMIKGVKPIIPLIVFTSILNMFFVAGDPIFKIGFFKITIEGVVLAAKMAFRIVALIVGTSLLTYTTSPIALTDAIESLLKPLKKVKFPVHEMAMMMSIALRFIPTLIEETDKIMSAQKARGADFETGNLLQRAKAMIPLLVPLFISAFRRADELAVAMECRCYHGGEGRTKLHVLHYQRRDYTAFVLGAAILGTVIALRTFGL